ncbi:MAG: hypothetical protein M1821_008026 [Bathelium mastoideum]|nr:MAG: hypothetical protein M1821_008026 [Bathelium mastoideum]KAI9693073.1 MAG: hypothetical protein M1822_005068 [Bathelium mastoideum]
MDIYAPKPVLQALAAVGLLYLSAQAFTFLRVLLDLFILPGTSLSKFGKKGSWAVITGASDGIGKEFATQIAAKGFNVVLISRTQSKLDTLASQLESKYGNIKTKTLAIDFAHASETDYEKIKSLTTSLDVSILVNNVGLSHSIPVPFIQTPLPELTDIITINCLATLRVTHLVAPQLARQRRGLILTLASFGGITPTPLLATYSGSKAFLQQWSSALGTELAPSGVTVQLVQSYLVVSAMSKIRRASALIPTPRAFVRAALGKVGRKGGAQGIAFTSTPFWSHGLMHWGLGAVTGTMNEWVVGWNLGMHEGIRRRALRKAEREGRKVE